MEKAFVSIVQADRKFYLVASKNEQDQWAVKGFKTLNEGLQYYEKGYEEFHNRSYESSMSACINWMMFQPAIVELSLEEMHVIVEKPIHVVFLRNIAGHMNGIPLLPEAETIWERGRKPELINDEMLHA